MLEPVPFRNPIVEQQKATSKLMVLQDWVRWFVQLRDDVNGWHPPSMVDADAQPNTVYYSLTGSKLSYKDPGGTVHALY